MGVPVHTQETETEKKYQVEEKQYADSGKWVKITMEINQ